MIAHQMVTTVADDSFYTFHRRHASPQLRRVRELAVNIGYSVDDDDDDDNHNKSSPKSLGKSHVAIPHDRQWTRPLRVLLSAGESNRSAAGTLHPHRSATWLHCIVRTLHQKKVILQPIQPTTPYSISD